MLAGPAPRALAVVEALMVDFYAGSMTSPAHVYQLIEQATADAEPGGPAGSTSPGAQAPTLATWGTTPEAQASMKAMERLAM